MKEITYLLDNYRECARHLWNTSFLELLSQVDERDVCETQDVPQAVYKKYTRLMIKRSLIL